MKILFLSLLLGAVLTGCAVKAGRQQPVEHLAAGIDLPDTLKVSAPFRMFVRELSAERAGISNPDRYEPSESLQKKYLLSFRNGRYYARGYLRVNEFFDPDLLVGLGGTITEYTGEIRSFSIPVDRLQELVRIPGIRYIELSRKVNLIKH